MDSVESKAPEDSSEKKKEDEMNAVANRKNTKKAEGDTNEREKINEKAESNEVDK